MIEFILTLVTLAYIGVSLLYFIQGNCAMGTVFIAYAIANIGLYFAGNLN